MIKPLGSFADETGHSKDPNRKFVGIAGLLAGSDSWIRFDSEWREICKDEGIILPFSMKDFAAFRQQFQNEWKTAGDARRIKALGRFVRAIKNAKAIPIGAIVSLDDFNSCSALAKSRMRDPYYLAFQGVTYNLAFAAAVHTAPGTVSMTYARHAEYSASGKELWYAIKDANPLIRYWMGSYTPGEPSDYSPLQAADIWAYELGHHFEYILPNKKPWRWAFNELVQMGMAASFGFQFFTFFDRDRMQVWEHP